MASGHSVVPSSGLKTQSAAIQTKRSWLYGVVLVGGSDAASAIVYDNATTGSGTVLAKLTAGAGETVQVCFGPPVQGTNGLYLALTGTGVGAIVYSVKMATA